MRDRIPTQVLENGALRYGVYDEAGNFLRHEYLALDDAPTDIGTELTKATLLRDSTEVSLFGAAADRTVDDAFQGLAGQLKLIMGDMASITVTLKDSAGTVIPGVLVQGILSDSGQAVYSDDSGVVSGYISEGTQVVKVTGYADIEDYSETLSVTKGTTISKTITLTTRNFLKLTSSQSVKFSGNVETVDVSMIGGGAGGSRGAAVDTGTNYGGAGGGSGYVTIENDIIPTANESYPAVIGAGGNGQTQSVSPGAGGNSSFMGFTANGGGAAAGKIGGTGGANGGNGADATSLSSGSRTGTSGSNASAAFFASFSEVEDIGGSGGGGVALKNISTFISVAAAGGGSAGGGLGGWCNYTLVDGGNGTDGCGAGGGGGATLGDNRKDNFQKDFTDGGKGGSGCIAVRMHLKSAA